MDSSQKRNTIIGLFIIFIMVASVLGYTLGSNEDAGSFYDYNGYRFADVNGIWQTYIGNTAYQFNYDPKSIENMSIPNFNINSNKVYFIYDPDKKVGTENAMQKIGALLRNKGNIIMFACSSDNNCGNLPIKTCGNFTETSFYFKTSNETQISLNSNCVVLEGDSVGLSKAADAINLKILGVF
jgi:hypothetical protein